MFQRKYRIIFLFYSVLTFFIFFIRDIFAVVQFWGTLFFYAGILYIFVSTWKYIGKKIIPSFFEFFFTFLLKSSFWLSIFFLLFGSFLLTQNEIFPAKLPLYVLSNGEKTLYFQTMSHIGSPNFYTQVQTNISSAKKQNFVLFFEGVRPGSPENHSAFDSALGVKFDEATYTSFSQLYGVVAQDNSLFLGLENTKDYNIDLSMDEVMELYRKKIPQNSGNVGSQEQKPNKVQDISHSLGELLGDLSERQLETLQYINQSILNFIIKHESFRNTMIELVGNPDILSVILDKRNLHIVSEIKKSEEKNIFIIYGLMHFEGVFKLLQADDSRWEIQRVEWFQLITDDIVSQK